jgi:hypothetical protein
MLGLVYFLAWSLVVAVRLHLSDRAAPASLSGTGGTGGTEPALAD